MTKKLIFALMLAVVGQLPCVGQTNAPHKDTVLGESVMGVELSITASNRLISAGSSSRVHCLFKNRSTNAVAIYTTGQPKYDFAVFLTDSTGNSSDVTPKIPLGAWVNNATRGINAGATYDVTIDIPIGKSVKPGTYQLKIKRVFLIRVAGKIVPGSEHSVESNPLNVQIE